MVMNDLNDPLAVLQAIEEFDELGREAFLDKYGFGHARDYFIEYKGGAYDSKAIVGAAHGFQFSDPLSNDDFSGGDATVATKLQKLGFTVTRPDRLPDWTNDELILALDLYLRTRDWIGYGKNTKEVVELSELLRSLPIFDASVRLNDRFRNPSGVALKIHNFESIDPGHPGVGMAHGSQADQMTWDKWTSRPEELAIVAAEIRQIGTQDSQQPPETGEDEELTADEGRILYREHRRYERDRRLVVRKKAAVLSKSGRLACEVCDFESSEMFGDEAAGVIDVHHIVPLYRIGQSNTVLADLALVCPTCHRVIHAHSPFLTPTELRNKLERRQSSDAVDLS
jgi:5-methylcytosine-specific restriction protein A